MVRDAPQRNRARDAGFSLTELAVYIVLLGIVTSIVSAVIVTSLRAEQTVSATTNTANDAQSIIATLDRDIRNSPVISPSSGVTDTISLCVASADDELSWSSVQWSFSNSSATRSVNDGTATQVTTIPLTAGTFEMSGKLVTYSFELSDAGTAQTFSSATALSPASQEGCS